jgi:hypothetical protein
VHHFASVGFAFSDQKQGEELLSTAFDRASERGDVVEHDEGQSAAYRDPSGATLIMHADRRGGFGCCQPGFEGSFHARWRPLGVVRDPDGCRFCDLVYAELLGDEDDDHGIPFALRIETMAADRALIPYEEPGEVRFAGLYESGKVWPDEATFKEAQEAEWADVPPPPELPVLRGWASRSLIPAGTFERGAMTPHVVAHGIVSSVEERQNELGQAPFKVVRLDTLGGVFDTCLAPNTLDHEELLAPGAVVGASLWLVGRPLTLRDEPGPVPSAGGGERTGLLGRLFGRRRR